MEARYKVFRSSFQKWESLFEEAATFASKIGEQRVINIGQCCDHSDAVVTVWYWDKYAVTDKPRDW